jgi:hypothetical protein
VCLTHPEGDADGISFDRVLTRAIVRAKRYAVDQEQWSSVYVPFRHFLSPQLSGSLQYRVHYLVWLHRRKTKYHPRVSRNSPILSQRRSCYGPQHEFHVYLSPGMKALATSPQHPTNSTPRYLLKVRRKVLLRNLSIPRIPRLLLKWDSLTWYTLGDCECVAFGRFKLLQIDSRG